MKIRNGFVSNSSSSCFILNIKDKGVKELLSKVTASYPSNVLARCTSKIVGLEAILYAKEWIEETGDVTGDGLGKWILFWAEKIGQENIVLLRESDEDDGLFGSNMTKNEMDTYDFDRDKWEKKSYFKELSDEEKYKLEEDLKKKLEELSLSAMEYH